MATQTTDVQHYYLASATSSFEQNTYSNSRTKAIKTEDQSLGSFLSMSDNARLTLLATVSVAANREAGQRHLLSVYKNGFMITQITGQPV